MALNVENYLFEFDSYAYNNQNGIPNKNYLIKIDEDYKITTDNFLTEKKLEKVVKSYYPTNNIDFFPLPPNSNLLLSSLTEPTSYLRNNEFDPKELIEKLNLFDQIHSYFNKIDKQNNLSKLFDYKNTILPLSKNFNVVPSVESVSTRLPVQNLKDYDIRTSLDNPVKNTNMFPAEHSLMPNTLSEKHYNIYGIYENSNDINNIESYINENNFTSTTFINLDNFSDLLLDHFSIYNIYFNSQFNNILVIQTTEDFISNNNKIKSLFPELVLISSEKLNSTQLEIIKKLNDDIFVNFDDARCRINRILHDKVIDSKLSIGEIKLLIKKYFDIDDNPDHCIKFTNIWSIISSEIQVSNEFVTYIKRQLPVILSDLGLQKKRLSDGIYWYGLVKKTVLEFTPNENQYINNTFHDTPISNDEINRLLKERDDIFQQFTPFTLFTNVIQTNQPNQPIQPIQPKNELVQNDQVNETFENDQSDETNETNVIKNLLKSDTKIIYQQLENLKNSEPKIKKTVTKKKPVKTAELLNNNEIISQTKQSKQTNQPKQTKQTKNKKNNK